MSQTAQVYRLRVNSAADIRNSLNDFTGRAANSFPRIENLRRASNRVTGTLLAQAIEHGDTIFPVCDFVFDTNSGLCYLIGSAAGRVAGVDILGRQIDDNNEVISHMELTNENILEDIFEILKDQHVGNFIKKLKLTFGATGLRYHSRTPLYELEYRLIGNVCASTHTDYDRFVNGAIGIRANFGIFNLGSVERRNPTTLSVSQDCSFRLWFDLPPSEWITILDMLTNFLV